MSPCNTVVGVAPHLDERIYERSRPESMGNSLYVSICLTSEELRIFTNPQHNSFGFWDLTKISFFAPELVQG